MSTFIATYVIFWLAVALYVVQLGGRQRKLLDRIASLQLRVQDSGCQQTDSLD
jgi:hypothetical protein